MESRCPGGKGLQVSKGGWPCRGESGRPVSGACSGECLVTVLQLMGVRAILHTWPFSFLEGGKGAHFCRFPCSYQENKENTGFYFVNSSRFSYMYIMTITTPIFLYLTPDPQHIPSSTSCPLYFFFPFSCPTVSNHATCTAYKWLHPPKKPASIPQVAINCQYRVLAGLIFCRQPLLL